MVQDAISTVILCAWLGGMSTESKPGEVGRLLTLEEIGQAFNGALGPLWHTHLFAFRTTTNGSLTSARQPQGS